MGDQLDSQTEESCTTYNILKVARHLYEWSADPSLADFYERALLNGIVGNQNRLNPNMTSFIYMLPLGGVVRKPWQSSNQGFACCWGTMSEQFSKLGDSLMFRSPENDALYVNLFASASVDWAERGVKVSLDASAFPVSETETASLTVDEVADGDAKWTLMIRVPAWAITSENSLSLNGAQFPAELVPGQYVAIGPRHWSAGDKVAFHFPMSLRFEQLDDPRPEWAGVGAILYGPLMLASIGPGASDHLAIDDITQLDNYIKRNSSSALTFSATARDVCEGEEQQLIPFNSVMDEEYAVYFVTSTERFPVVNSSTASLPADRMAWRSHGATAVTADKGYDLRTGSPHQQTAATLQWPVLDQSQTIRSLEFSYQYVTGYCRDPAALGTAPNFSLVLQPCDEQKADEVLYTSAPLGDYLFDVCHTWPDCYSPNIKVALNNLDVDASSALRLSLEFQNNDRNLQLRLPITFNLTWSNGEETQLVMQRRARAHEYFEEDGFDVVDTVEDALRHPDGFEVFL